MFVGENKLPTCNENMNNFYDTFIVAKYRQQKKKLQ